MKEGGEGEAYDVRTCVWASRGHVSDMGERGGEGDADEARTCVWASRGHVSDMGDKAGDQGRKRARPHLFIGVCEGESGGRGVVRGLDRTCWPWSNLAALDPAQSGGGAYGGGGVGHTQGTGGGVAFPGGFSWLECKLCDEKFTFHVGEKIIIPDHTCFEGKPYKVIDMI